MTPRLSPCSKRRDLNLDRQNPYKCWVLMAAYLWFQPQKADRNHHSKVDIQLNSGFDLKNLTSRRIGWTACKYIERRKRKQAMYVHDSCNSRHFTPLCCCLLLLECSWQTQATEISLYLRPFKVHLWGPGRWLGQETACFASMRTWSPSLGSKQTKAEYGFHPCNPKSREADTGGSQA